MVWGADGGIGGALVEALKEAGWQTIAIGRGGSSGPEHAGLVLEADVSDPKAVEQAVYSAAQEVDQVQLWIYAVGDILSAPTAELTPQDWTRILNANLGGAFITTHYSLPLLAEDAHLIFLGGISERLRLPGLSAYAAAKAGLEAFAETLGKEQRKRRVTVVRPSAVDTPLWDKVPLRLPKDAPSPGKVAGRILEAHEQGYKGQLDLTG
jgi:NAD(P)-dependent dehydrogenase (short-subunit alcohol dehydrogenase family)